MLSLRVHDIARRLFWFYIVAVFSLRHCHRSCLSLILILKHTRIYAHTHTHIHIPTCTSRHLVGPVMFQPKAIFLLNFILMNDIHSYIYIRVCKACDVVVFIVARSWCPARRRCFSFTNYTTLSKNRQQQQHHIDLFEWIWMKTNWVYGAKFNECICVCVCAQFT